MVLEIEVLEALAGVNLSRQLPWPFPNKEGRRKSFSGMTLLL